MSDRICLRLARRDMAVFRTIDRPGQRPVVHVAGRHPAVCVRRFVCEEQDCEQTTFDERFEGIDRGGASTRALGFFADLARGRATRAVARDLGVPEHYLRIAVGSKRRVAHGRLRGRLGAHLAIDECSVRKNFVYATVFSDPDRGVVIDMAPGRDASAVLFFAGLFSHAERCRVRVVTIDCHAPYRMAARALFPNAVVVADAFHVHRRALAALTEVRRDAWNRWRHRSKRLGKVFKDARFALARSRDALEADDSRRGHRQRLAVYDAVNLDPELGTAYELKEAFRAAMAIGKAGDVDTFAAALELFDALCIGSGIPAFASLAKTLREWRTEIVNYAVSGGKSNAFAEAIIHLIKNQKRQAHGYRSWAGFRGQILWAFGEAVDPDTGEVVPLRTVPRGEGATWLQPQFT